MRIIPLWRLAALLLLLAGTLAGPARLDLIGAGAPALAAQDDDTAEEAREDAEERREEAEEERQEAEEERLEDEEDRLEEEREAAEDQVQSTAAYAVEVACVPTPDAAGAECVITGVAPEGGKKIARLVVPDDALCADVRETDGDRVDPDPQSNVTGYASRGKGATLTLVFDGAVTTGGSATYWLRAASDVVPATGPGFVCDEPATEAPSPVAPLATLEDRTADLSAPTPPATLEPTPTPTPVTTGSVTVGAYACPAGAAADAADYDWYGACDAGGDHRYVLAPIDNADADDLRAADTAKAGEATFTDVPPGRYDLDDVDGAWCHAESDAVNAEGDVVVEAGVATTVWLFYCQPAAP